MAKKVSIQLSSRDSTIEAICDSYEIHEGCLTLYEISEFYRDDVHEHVQLTFSSNEWLDIQVTKVGVEHP